jgi:DNA (cytosine-5)-methyltransferase 1
MKLLSLFSGIGAFEKALDNLKIPYELVGYCEIDKYASKSYSAIHNVSESMNLGDITKINEKALPKDIDLITYGFPCQDISLAGKQKGLFNEDGTQTRSGLFFEALRIIEETKPKIAIAENVKNLLSKKFNAQFQIVLASLDAAGYNNYFQVLNAKDYGIPQNRERVFIVSIRKDIDNGDFKFPGSFPLELRLKDMLEDDVDEKYYLKETQLYFIKHSYDSEAKGNGFRFNPHVRNNADVAKTITTRAGARMDDNFVMDIESNQATFKFDSTNEINMIGLLDIKGNEQVRRVYGADGIRPTLNTMQGGNRQPKIFVREATKKGYAEAHEGDSINLEQPNSKTRRGRVGKQVAQTLTTSPQQGVAVSDLRIRKLTPKECFRLMGFDDEDFVKAEAVNSNTQLYKQAGNSIVVDVVEHLIKALCNCGVLKCSTNGE